MAWGGGIRGEESDLGVDAAGGAGIEHAALSNGSGDGCWLDPWCIVCGVILGHCLSCGTCL